MQLVRNQCGEVLKDSSWKMVFAGSEDEFEAMWQEMKTQMDGLGYQDLVAYDKDVWADYLAEVAAAAK